MTQGASAATLHALQAVGGNLTQTGQLPRAAGTNGSGEARAIGNLVASSVQLGADLAASGHAVSLAADEKVCSFLPA